MLLRSRTSTTAKSLLSEASKWCTIPTPASTANCSGCSAFVQHEHLSLTFADRPSRFPVAQAYIRSGFNHVAIVMHPRTNGGTSWQGIVNDSVVNAGKAQCLHHVI